MYDPDHPCGKTLEIRGLAKRQRMGTGQDYKPSSLRHEAAQQHLGSGLITPLPSSLIHDNLLSRPDIARLRFALW